MKKKTAALLLTLGLMLSMWLIPISGSAGTITSMADIQALVDAIAPSGQGTITLDQDVFSGGTQTIPGSANTAGILIGDGKDVVLDLNGFDLEHTGANYTLYVMGGAKLTITGTGDLANGTGACIGIDTDGTVNLDQAAITISSRMPGYGIDSFGTLTIKDSSLGGTAGSPMIGVCVQDGSTATMTGNASVYGSVYGVTVYGTFHFNGGTITSATTALDNNGIVDCPQGKEINISANKQSASLIGIDTSVKSLKIGEIAAQLDTDTEDTFTLALPFGSTLPTDADELTITPTDENASVSIPVSADHGATWTFTVTAEKTTLSKEYTLSIEILPDPLIAQNETDVNELLSALRARDWTFLQSEANDAASLLAEMRRQLDSADLNGCTVDLLITAAKPATAGTRENPQGNDGSFTYSLQISKGSGDNLARTQMVNGTGTIRATAYQTTDQADSGNNPAPGSGNGTNPYTGDSAFPPILGILLPALGGAALLVVKKRVSAHR